MKFTSKSLKIISLIFIILSSFTLGFTFALLIFQCGNHIGIYSGLAIVFAMISGFLTNAAKKEKEQESNKN